MKDLKQQYVWNDINLEDLRQIMDKPADNAVQSVYESKSMNHLRELLTKMAKNDDFISSDLPEPMHQLIQSEVNSQFSASDINYFKETHEIWKKHGANFIFILFFRALPYTYMAEKPANVLRITRLLETDTERRIFETAQFVFDVMDKNWWEPDKRGILTALKVRIMHAAMRHIILISGMRGETWNPEWGMPISQEDMIATNQVFSLEFIKGMEMLGLTLSGSAQEAWFHTWKTIGRIMGVQENLISKNVKEAWSLQHAVYAHLFKDQTYSGIGLAKALVETLQRFYFPERLILLLMKHMLTDDQFPDCFERMLGPSYESIYPELFEVHDNEADRQNHREKLRGYYHEHLKEYHQYIQSNKHQFKVPVENESLLEKLVTWILRLFGRIKSRKNLIELHLDKIHNLLHDKNETPVEKLEEEGMIESMTSLSNIMIGLLAIHFRKGKDSGFRISKNLKEHWLLH